jgi:hypothetical protein
MTALESPHVRGARKARPVVRLTRRGGRALVAGVAALGALAGIVAATPPANAMPAAHAASPTDPVSLAVVVPLTLPTSAQGTGLISPEDLATDTAPTGVLTRQLAAVSGTGAVLAIDPMILVSIRVLGTAMPPSARAWLAQLEALPNEKIPLAYADADPAALARVAGGLAELSSLDFQFDINASAFSPPVTDSPTPTPAATASATPAPGADGSPTPAPTTAPGPTPAPSNADLLAAPGGYVASDIAWPAAGTVAQDQLAPLAAAGYHRLLLSSANVSSSSSARVELGDVEGLVSDDGLSGLAREAVTTTGDGALQRFDTALAGAQAVAPGRTLITTFARGWSVSAGRLHELLLNIAGQSTAQLVGLSAILAGPSTDAKLVSGRIPDDGADLLAPVLATVAQEAAFATVAGDRSAAITSPRRLALLSTMSVAWIETKTGWADRLRAYLASSAALLDSVKITHGSGVLVTASSTNIPVNVTNALDVPIVVDVSVQPSRNLLRVSKQAVQLRVEPMATGRVLVPAQALSTGTVTASIVLHSAASPGVQIGPSDSIDADLRPSWESIGTGFILVLLVLIFGGGIARQVLRRRRQRRERAAAAETDEQPAPKDEG